MAVCVEEGLWEPRADVGGPVRDLHEAGRGLAEFLEVEVETRTDGGLFVN